MIPYQCSLSIINSLHLLVASVVNGVGHSLLDLLGESLLQCLGHLAVASGVADLASLLVGAGVVDRVWEFVFELLGDLGVSSVAALLIQGRRGW